MTSARPPINRWTEPGTLVGIFGLLMVGWSGYRDFQDDSREKISALEVQVAVLQTDSAQHEKRFDRLDEWMGERRGK